MRIVRARSVVASGTNSMGTPIVARPSAQLAMAPGLRLRRCGVEASTYAAFVIGPDGHNIEVVCHESSP